MEDARTQGRSEKAGHAHGEMGCNRGSIVQGLPTQGNTPELFGSLLSSFCPIQLRQLKRTRGQPFGQHADTRRYRRPLLR